ncbi:hypothetical protein Tco_1563367 [Tanacetum coccineum]
MTATEALMAIQEMDYHSQKWHDGGSIIGLGGSSSDGISVRSKMCGETHCHLKDEVKSIKATGYGEGKNNEIIGRCLEISGIKQDSFKEWMKRFRENTYRNLKRHDYLIKGLKNKVEQLAQAVHSSMTNDSKSTNQVKIVITKSSPNTHYFDSNTAIGTCDISNLVEKEIIMRTGESNETLKSALIVGNFSDKAKRRIAEEQEKTFLESLEKVPINTPLIVTIRQTPYYMKSLQELVSKKTRIEEVSMVKLNARCLFLMNDDINEDLGNFLELNDLLPENNGDPFGVLSDSGSDMGIRLDESSGNQEDLLNEQAAQFG